MISQDRQLEIAKECGVDLHYITDSVISFWTHELDAYTARIEAEVIATMKPVYEEFDDVFEQWKVIDIEDYDSDNELHRILYRLPDSKTEEEL